MGGTDTARSKPALLRPDTNASALFNIRLNDGQPADDESNRLPLGLARTLQLVFSGNAQPGRSGRGFRGNGASVRRNEGQRRDAPPRLWRAVALARRHSS